MMKMSPVTEMQWTFKHIIAQNHSKKFLLFIFYVSVLKN